LPQPLKDRGVPEGSLAPPPGIKKKASVFDRLGEKTEAATENPAEDPTATSKGGMSKSGGIFKYGYIRFDDRNRYP